MRGAHCGEGGSEGGGFSCNAWLVEGITVCRSSVLPDTPFPGHLTWKQAALGAGPLCHLMHLGIVFSLFLSPGSLSLENSRTNH